MAKAPSSAAASTGQRTVTFTAAPHASKTKQVSIRTSCYEYARNLKDDKSSPFTSIGDVYDTATKLMFLLSQNSSGKLMLKLFWLAAQPNGPELIQELQERIVGVKADQ